jgi:ribosome-binding factor A
MRPEEIKRRRTESILRELLPEALSTLDDERINTLGVNEVVCSRGRYDARVYLDGTGLDESEKSEALKRLRKVTSYLSRYVRESEGWYKSPNFRFEFDDRLEKMNHIDELFKQIEGRRDGES